MGKLRVATHVGNPILAARTLDGSVSGVTIDLGKFIAERLGVSFEPVIYANQETYAQSFGKGEWDIAIGSRSALAAEKSDLSPDFMLADTMYIDASGREFADVGQVDWRGVKVGVSRDGGAD
jgi:polar amino acid transport system substrate-binding protein